MQTRGKMNLRGCKIRVTMIDEIVQIYFVADELINSHFSKISGRFTTKTLT